MAQPSINLIRLPRFPLTGKICENTEFQASVSLYGAWGYKTATRVYSTPQTNGTAYLTAVQNIHSKNEHSNASQTWGLSTVAHASTSQHKEIVGLTGQSPQIVTVSIMSHYLLLQKRLRYSFKATIQSHMHFYKAHLVLTHLQKRYIGDEYCLAHRKARSRTM